MRLPSLSHVFTQLSSVLLRFPILSLVTVTGTLVLIYSIEHDLRLEQHRLLNLIITCALGIPLLLAFALRGEQFGRSTDEQPNASAGIIAQLIGLACLSAYFFFLPSIWDYAPEYYIIQYALLSLAAHFAVSVAPFKPTGVQSSFWTYNQILFINILTAALYSLVLFLGLTIALVSIENLFNVHVNSKLYVQIFVFIAGIFNTFFFLSGVPDQANKDNTEEPYPKGLKIFTQYVLIPLVTLYLIILYSYAAKIVVEASLPKGWVSYLIMGYSTLGIFALLLVHPIKDREENSWINTFSKWFYLALVPLLVLLYVAALRRVVDYGITEPRYLLLLLAVWLTGTTIYFIFSTKKNIKMLPLSLCLLGLFSAFGPWGASGVSKYSQQQRIWNVLQANGVLNEQGKAGKFTKAPSKEDAETLSSCFDYLNRVHGVSAIQPFFNEDIKALMINDSLHTIHPPTLAFKWLGLDTLNYIPDYVENYSFYVQDPEAVLVTGYDMLLSNIMVDMYNRNIDNNQKVTVKEFTFQQKKYSISQNPQSGNIYLQEGADVLWQANIDSMALEMANKHGQYPPTLAQNELIFQSTTPQKVKLQMLLTNLSANKSPEGKMLTTYFSGSVLIDFP
ncbi:MAG: DUF4153 domain-containing protein [Sphingobacteriales bacterium]|nr:MAG: DUF4153 domain-containing protein [Sphingobacteriales bacterium]